MLNPGQRFFASASCFFASRLAISPARPRRSPARASSAIACAIWAGSALSGNNLVQPAMQTTRAIPIVMINSTAPVEAGLVASLVRPGGNVTGLFSEAASDLDGKRLEILKQLAPRISRVAFLLDREVLDDQRPGSVNTFAMSELRTAARRLGVTLLPFGVDTVEDLQAAIRLAMRQGADALLVRASLSAAQKDQPAFHSLAERHKLPAMYSFLNAVRSGGLVCYGRDPSELYGRAAVFIDRILKGGKPAEMPVEQPDRYRLTINLKAARAIGLEIPQSLLVQADEVIR